MNLKQISMMIVYQYQLVHYRSYHATPWSPSKTLQFNFRIQFLELEKKPLKKNFLGKCSKIMTTPSVPPFVCMGNNKDCIDKVFKGVRVDFKIRNRFCKKILLNWCLVSAFFFHTIIDIYKQMSTTFLYIMKFYCCFSYINVFFAKHYFTSYFTWIISQQVFQFWKFSSG